MPPKYNIRSSKIPLLFCELCHGWFTIFTKSSIIKREFRLAFCMRPLGFFLALSYHTSVFLICVICHKWFSYFGFSCKLCFRWFMAFFALFLEYLHHNWFHELFKLLTIGIGTLVKDIYSYNWLDIKNFDKNISFNIWRIQVVVIHTCNGSKKALARKLRELNLL